MRAKQFFSERFPELFRRGVELLEESASRGSEGAKRRLEDICGARGVAWIQLDGEGDVFLKVQDGTIERADDKPDELPVRFAVGLSAEAADAFLADAERAVDLSSDAAAYAAARTASARVEQAIGSEPLELHLIVNDTPDFEKVVVRLGLNAEAPPETPKFTATVAWDDLEAVRTGKLLPQQLFMSGKLRLGGDYSRALSVAMQLMQQRGGA
jgi:hypothetical protein